MRIRLAIAASLLTVGTLAVTTSAPASAEGDSDRKHVAAAVVRLNGAQETQPADPDGSGIFAFVAFDSKLCYVLTARRIEPATAAHIHAGGRGVAGDIVVGLRPPTEGLSADCITAVPGTSPDLNVLLQSELDAIIARPSDFYVNVHNDPFPAGAIRGQLR
jgi:hypothetical protein